MSDSSMKAALPTSETDFKAIRSAYDVVPSVLDETAFIPWKAVCVRDGLLVNLHENITNYLISGGIVQYWFNYLLNFESMQLIPPAKQPKVFAVEDLKFGFHVWLCASAISLIAFASEILYVAIKVRMRKLIQESVRLTYFVKFIQQKLFM